MEKTYGEYRLVSVYQTLDDALRREICAFWERNNAIRDPAEAWRRTQEVVLVIRAADNSIAGITSAYVADFDGVPHYFYRMFMAPTHRGVYNMMIAATTTTREVLRDSWSPGKPRSIVIVTENNKLMRPGMHHVFEERGYHYAGRGPRGFDVWTRGLR
ncbi:MAG: hypothetical protein GVY29_03090 [Spirochaetes bacterium]|nr:hypothetical protein [Spirochaetota bacterium]